jgi:hypothetical protein
MKKKQAISIINIFPEEFHPNITEKFEECYTTHNDQLKKEPNGCETWLGYTGCFYEFSQNVNFI